MGDLDGKVALITGGGTGIGAAIAETFAAEGALVTITGRRPAPLAEVAERITGTGGAALGISADVTDLDAMQRAVDATVERFGRLDVVVANAGVAPAMTPALDCSLEQWRAIVEIDLTGVWITAKTSVPALRVAGGGTIIVLGSGAGRANTGGLGPYSAAKAGVTALCRVLATELRSDNIAVNELIPGPVRTPALDIFRGGRRGAGGASALHRRVAEGARRRRAPRALPRDPPDRRNHRPGVQPRGAASLSDRIAARALPPSHWRSTVVGGSTSRRT